MKNNIPNSILETFQLLQREHFVADRELATMLFLSLSLKRPLLLEGPSGVGKSELGTVLAKGLDRRLIRLQCYEGLDISSAVYEWNYAGQMIEIRLAEQGNFNNREALLKSVFSEKYLVKRPILEALVHTEEGGAVLLIDEIDRADSGFEAFLLEILSDFQVSVPELGTIGCDNPPIILLTSNRTREISDALRRRCFFYQISYPDASGESNIIEHKAPGIRHKLTETLEELIYDSRLKVLRFEDLERGSMAWASTLLELDREEIDPGTTGHKVSQFLLRQQQDSAQDTPNQIAELENSILSDGDK